MPLDLHVVEDVRDDTLFIDDDGCSGYAHIRAAVVLLFYPNAVLLYELPFWVCQEREWKRVLLFEIGMGFHAIRADSDYSDILIVE